MIAGTIIHLCNSGFLRHLWLSTSSDLIQDATRDIRDIKGKVAVRSNTMSSAHPHQHVSINICVCVCR